MLNSSVVCLTGEQETILNQREWLQMVDVLINLKLLLSLSMFHLTNCIMYLFVTNIKKIWQ